jgi:hypothetical protein
MTRGILALGTFMYYLLKLLMRRSLFGQVIKLSSLVLKRYNLFQGTTYLPGISTSTIFSTCPTLSWLNLLLINSIVPNLQDNFESYSFPLSQVSPILPSTYLLEWYLDRLLSIFLDLQGDIQF